MLSLRDIVIEASGQPGNPGYRDYPSRPIQGETMLGTLP